MSKPWDPRSEGWAGQWDRHRWPMPGQRPRRPRRRRSRFTRSEIRLTVLACLLVFLATAQAIDTWAPPAAAPESGFVNEPGTPVRPAAVRVIDGDTFDHGGVRVRVADIDTPEVDGRCAYETDLAARATNRLRALLASGDLALHPSPDGRDEDRYGRKLRIVTRGGRSVGDMLVAEGLARTWTGRREPWCV